MRARSRRREPSRVALLLIEHLDRDAEVKQETVARPRAGDEREHDDAAVVQLADRRAVVVPRLREDGRRADAHQDSTSTVSTTTSAARGSRASPSTRARTTAPSAIVPRAAC